MDTARFLGGSRFDFKVEFDGELAEKDAKVLINGQDAKAVLGAKPEFIAKEKGPTLPRCCCAALRSSPTVQSDGGEPHRESLRQLGRIRHARQARRQERHPAHRRRPEHGPPHERPPHVQGVTNGMYNGKLSMDTLPYTAMLGTCSVDSIAADSANTASAYMTGHKSSVNALGVYADRTPDSLDDPKQETIAELLRRTTGKSIGVVSDAEIEDATPASVVGHTRRRADKAEIVDMFYSVKPDVIIGGGSAYFLPQNVPGSKRKDDKNYVEMFQKEGYALATSNTELSKAVKGNPDKLLGLFHTGNMDGVLDRKFLKKGTVSKFPDQPDLTDSMRAALSVLSKNPEGFFLMLEAGLVDKYSHPLDWERAVYDTIMFDKVVAIAQEFCDKNPDTLLIVTGDHTHSISVIGTVDDNLPGELMRDKVGIYAEAGYPAYKDENGDGYPDDVNVSKRLAVFIGNYPDHYETYRPKMDGPFVPSVKDEKGHYIANAAYKDVPGAQLRIGNLPRTESTGVHSIDDLVVGARGPHADAFRGFMNSTDVFRIMSEALALGNK
ncbi:MAG: alkaline phosphatase [Bilophila wadsworthia]